jgi:hypothetical protein
LRAFLGQKRAKKGSLSQYVEEAVNAAQERNLQYSEAEIEESIHEAIREIRSTSRS